MSLPVLKLTKRLSQNQLKAVGMLASGRSCAEVASTLSVSTRTVERWQDKPEIAIAVESAKAKAIAAIGEEIFEKCRNSLTKGLPKSIKRILEGLDDPDARIRIRSAEMVAKWSGFYQPTAPPKPEAQGNAEGNLKGYLAYLEMNGNAHQHK